MDKKLPSIFKNQIDKEIENNKKVFYSKYETVSNVVEKTSEVNSSNDMKVSSLSSSLDELLKNNQFIFNVPVEISLKNEILNTKIVSKVGDHLLTSNGKIINLEDVLLIKIKDK